MPDEMMVPPDVVYVTYIRTSAERVWRALTAGADTQHYFFGLRIASEWRVGARWTLLSADGSVHDEGEVLECDPPRRLKITWRMAFEDARELSPAFITYDIEPASLEDGAEAVRLTMTQHQPTPIPRKFYEGGLKGWPAILSSLKSYLETGAALKIVMTPPA